MSEVEPNLVLSCRGEWCRAGRCRVSLYRAESCLVLCCRVSAPLGEPAREPGQRLSCCQWQAQ
jgi:hypothetical protein